MPKTLQTDSKLQLRIVPMQGVILLLVDYLNEQTFFIRKDG